MIGLLTSGCLPTSQTSLSTCDWGAQQAGRRTRGTESERTRGAAHVTESHGLALRSRAMRLPASGPAALDRSQRTLRSPLGHPARGGRECPAEPPGKEMLTPVSLGRQRHARTASHDTNEAQGRRPRLVRDHTRAGPQRPTAVRKPRASSPPDPVATLATPPPGPGTKPGALGMK